MGRIALVAGWLLVVGAAAGVTMTAAATAAGPPRPGTTDSGLNETEEATLWSKVPSDYWAARPGEDTTVHELATGTELTFTEPPGLAERWNRYAYEQYRPGDTDVSVHPVGAYTHSYSYIEDAHATIFSMEPSTRAYVGPDDQRLYVAPNGTLRGVVDYRVDVPEDSDSGSGSTTYRLVDHGIEAVRFLVDDERVDTRGGTHRPTFEYELPFDAETLTLEARVEATVKKTVRPPPDSDRSTRTYTYDVWVEVRNFYEIEVYDAEAGVDRVRYPDGDEGVAITQAQPWQGYTLDPSGEAEIRGIWRFYLARTPGWGWLVESTDRDTTPRESDALPVGVNAYPSAMAPRAKPEGGEPTILRTDASLEDSVRGSYLHERADTAVATYKAVENGQRVFDQELVVTVRADTRSPVVIDPFAREDGYAKFTVGDPGSGKSFSSKQQFIRTLARDSDRIGIVLEPLNNWNGVIEALGGHQITVGGDLGLNPLEIKPMPEQVLAKRGEDASLLKERRNRVMSFFRNFFAHRGVELGPRRTTLERAIETAYERKGITDDAVWLLDQLWPFAEGGQFGNLGRQSEFDIREEKVLYLDLVQQGGSIGGQTSLLMELLISLVYERAKETDKEVVFVIDEARYLMKDSATLEYLETIFRHHRHHDLSIQLITQTVDEFLARDISKIILDQCAIKQFHKLDGMDEEIADVFGLNHARMRYVQNAIPGGDERGYSQALVGVDGDWRGIEVWALPEEMAVIENEYAGTDDTDEGSV